MTLTRQRALAAFMAAALSLAGLLSFASPAKADSRLLNVLLLGDSYSAGNGAGGYEGASGCYRSKVNWAGRYATYRENRGDKVNLINAACHGSTTSTYWGSKNVTPWDTNDSASGGFQRDYIAPSTDMILLTMGGNDVGFSEIVKNA